MNLNLIIYLSEVSVLISIFYLFYRYLYFKLAYFNWSRYYLISVLFLSLLIPLLPGIFHYNFIQRTVFQLFNASNSGTVTGLIRVDKSISNETTAFFHQYPFIKIIIIIWISGVIRYTFRIVKNILSVLKLIKQGEKFNSGNVIIVKTQSVKNVFSFFRCIFINDRFEQLNKEEQKSILNHEKIHAQQLHSFDNLIFEIYRAVFWFNPVSKLIAGDIKIIHEFIADNKVTGNQNKPDYSMLLLKLSAESDNLFSVNNFSKEEIKNRIKLIRFPEKEKIRKRRFIISIPILIVSVFASWFIISSVNTFIKIQNNKNKTCHKPFDTDKYKIISPYFENKKLNGITVSHKEASYEIMNFSNIYALENGIITENKTKDIFGLKEYHISEYLNSGFVTEYSGLQQSFVQTGDSVKRGEIIGRSGDIRLYPAVNIKLSKNNKTYNPEDFY